MTGYTYLASPYTHSDPAVREARYCAALACCAWMLKKRIWVYAPIVHNHVIAVQHEMPVQFAFWRDYDHALLEGAKSLCVLMIDGWRESVGVTDEREYAAKLGLGISFVVPRADGGYRFSRAKQREDVS